MGVARLILEVIPVTRLSSVLWPWVVALPLKPLHTFHSTSYRAPSCRGVPVSPATMDDNSCTRNVWHCMLWIAHMHALNKHAAIALNECVNYLTRTCTYSTFAFIILVHFIAFQAVAFKSTQGVAAVWPDWVAAMTIFCALIDILQGIDREIPNYYCAIIISCIDCKEVILLL